MDKEQEYINFWATVKNKCDEVYKDYQNLSEENKKRVDCVKHEISHANTLSDIMDILNNQLKQ